MKRIIFVLSALALAWACSKSSTGPSAFEAVAGGGTNNSTVTTGATAPAPAPAPAPTAGACDSLEIDFARISVRVDGQTVAIYVPATNADYVDFWVPELNNGTKYRGPVNETFYLIFAPGEYTWRMAIERSNGDGTVVQCDRAHGTFVIETPGNPPGPSCNVPKLKRLAAEECGELGVRSIDEESCSFVCNEPGPECTVDCEPPPCGESIQGCEPPPKEHGKCFYEVAGKKDHKKQLCEEHGGEWQAFDEGSFHCGFDFPGIAHEKFNLSPGISDPDCLRKQDDD